MKYAELLSLTLASLFLFGCSTEQSPSQIYNEYNSKIIAGISYDEDKAYYSKRKQDEVESKFPQYMEQMNKSQDEVIEFYLNFSREVAKCKEITLVNQVIEADTAFLEYSQIDICGNKSTSQEKQTIRMIKEDGWKIDDVAITL